jgi:type III secretory pathway component EscU
LIKKLFLFKLQNLSSFFASKAAKFSVNEATHAAGVTLLALHVATTLPSHSAQIGSVIKADSISTNHQNYN